MSSEYSFSSECLDVQSLCPQSPVSVPRVQFMSPESLDSLCPDYSLCPQSAVLC